MTYVTPGKLPCALLQVARDGQLVHQTVLGHACLETGAALAEDTIVRIYSMTKPITSVAFMMLVEEGLVALDDPVHRFIPSWRDLAVYRSGLPGAFQTEPVRAPMRIIDLLRHTSGLTYGFQMRTTVDAAYRAARLGPFEQTEARARRLHRGALEDAARVLARHGLELLGVDRRAGLSGRPHLGRRLRRVPAAAHLRAARHGRHGLPCPRGQARALRRVLRELAAGRPGADVRALLPRADSGAVGRRRAGLHRRRLPALLRGDAPGRRARRGAPARPEDGAPDARRPPARRARPGRPVGVDVLRGQLPGRGLRPRLRDDEGRGEDRRSPARWASTGGAAWPPPPSGSTRWRTSASSSSPSSCRRASTRSGASCAAW